MDDVESIDSEPLLFPSRRRSLQALQWSKVTCRWPAGVLVLFVVSVSLLIWIIVPYPPVIRKSLAVFALRSISSNATTSATLSSLRSDTRGHVAVLYSGQVRTFSSVFHSHIMHLFAASPYTVHLFMHFNLNSTEDRMYEQYSDMHTVNATLNFYSGYTNIDGERISLHQIIKSMTTTDIASPTFILTFEHSESLKFLLTRSKSDTNPSNMMLSMHSLHQANLARLEYGRAHNITYDLVMRVRPDFYFKTNVWNALFNVTSRKRSVDDTNIHRQLNSSLRWSNDGESEYDLHDMHYRSLLNASFVVAVPGCQSWYGANDQFAVSNSKNMNVYADRALNLTLIHELISRDSWKFQSESFLLTALRGVGIDIKELPMCYSVPRVHRPVHWNINSPLYNPSSCSLITSLDNEIGLDCCQFHCNSINAWNNQTLDSLTSTSASSYAFNVTSLPSYLQSMPAFLQLNPLDSNFYYFHMYSQFHLPVGCRREFWPSPLDPFHFHRYPFMHTAKEFEEAFERVRTCLRV